MPESETGRGRVEEGTVCEVQTELVALPGSRVCGSISRKVGINTDQPA